MDHSSARDCVLDYSHRTALSLHVLSRRFHGACLAITLPSVLAIADAAPHLIVRYDNFILSGGFFGVTDRRGESLFERTPPNRNMIVLADLARKSYDQGLMAR